MKIYGWSVNIKIQNEQTEKQKDVVDPKITMNQFNIVKIYTIFIQQQDTNYIQVSVDYKLGDTRIYPDI